MSTPTESEEELNAFVDGQLNANDHARVLDSLVHDAVLQKRMGEIQQTRDLLRLAYAHPPRPQVASRPAPALHKHKLALAASLVIGMVLGGLLHYLAAPTALLADNTPKGVVIQVSEADPAKWQMALINARNVQKAYGDQPMDVEIVAYGPGLKMLRNDSLVAADLEEARKDGVKLLACENTMRMTGTTRQDLNWLVDVVPAGIVEIMQKQTQGYAYVRP